MNPLWCVLLPVAVETVWAVAVLPRTRRNLRIPEDAPAKMGAESYKELRSLVFFVFIAYHWPLLVALLVWRSRLPFWVIVVCLVLTAGFYVGLLLLFASG